jgi:hypothetical protein
MPLNNPIQSTSIINPLSIAVEVDELLEQDFLSLHDKIDSIETSLEGLNVNVDLSPVMTKLDVIEDKIDSIPSGGSSVEPTLEQLKYIAHYWVDADSLSDSVVNTELTSIQEFNGKTSTGSFIVRQNSNGKKYLELSPTKYFSFPQLQVDFNYFDIFILGRWRTFTWDCFFGDYSTGKWFATANYHGNTYFYYIGDTSRCLTQATAYNNWGVFHYRFSGLFSESFIKASGVNQSGIPFNNDPIYQVASDGRFDRSTYRLSDYVCIGEPLPWHTSYTDMDVSKFIMFISRERHQIRDIDRQTIFDYLVSEKQQLI